MRSLTSRIFLLFILIAFNSSLYAQGFTFNCTRDTSINLCNTSQCMTLKTIIPDIHANTTSYTVNPTSTIPGCFPVYVQPNDPAGTSASLTTDDVYSSLITPGFSFPFYGATYTQVVASTNGYLSFDNTRAGASSHYAILNNGGSLSANTGTPQDLPSTLYDKALIMGPYHDIDIAYSTSPNRRIQYQVVGTAPHRRWILSFYKIPLFTTGTARCDTLIENTHQIILYESTGIVEVTIFSKQICTAWNQGRAMIGMQDMARAQAIMVPNRKASSTPWGSVNMNESYRFVPSAGTALIKRVELYDLSGTLIGTGTTTSLGNGQLEASFPNICPAMGVNTYIVKPVYQKIDDPTQEIFGSDTVRVTRTSSNSLTATATHVPTACGPNGSITVTLPPGMGAPPFAYVLDGGTPQNSTNQTYTFTGVSAGAHSVTITDANGCTITLPVTVTSTNVLSVTNSVVSSCLGGTTGSITFSPQNGQAPIQYQIASGPGITTPGSWQTSNVFSNLGPGTYYFNIKDNSTCSINNYSVTISPTYLPISASSNPPSCNGASNGSITVNPPTSGTGPFMYSLNGGPYVTNNVFSNLGPGMYAVSLKDAIGCQSANTIVTIGPASGSLTATTATLGTSCTGVNNGSVTVTPTSGSGPYQYSLNGGTTWQTSNVFTNLAPGNYNVTVKDNAGCTSSPIAFTITAGSGLAATTATTATSCPGAANGSITITPTNGASPYSFVLDGGTPQTSGTFTNVASGSHTILITDASGCSSGAITVNVAAGPAFTGTATSSSTSCTGAADATITATPTNGTGPFTYSLNGGSFQASNTFTNIPSGNYNIVIKDAAGCVTASIPVTVVAGPALTGTATSTATTCNGASNGTITATAGNGTGPFTYSLNGNPFQASNTFSNLAPGNYTITIKSASGCTTTAIPVTVGQGSPLSATSSTAATSCNGAADGTATITPTSGTAPYQYSVDGGSFTTGTGNITGLTSGTHTIIVKDAIGCTSNTITVTVPAGGALTGSASSTATSCPSASNGVITVTANGSGSFTYALDGGTAQSSNIFNNVSQGSHSVIISNAFGCTSAPIPVTVNAGAALTGTATSTTTSCNGANNGSITVTPTNGSGPYQYSLNGGAFQSGNTFTNLAPNNYNVVIKDAAGCTSASIPVTVGVGSLLTATVTPVTTSCSGAADGSINVVPTSGSGPYQYSFDGGSFTVGNGQYTNVASGNHTIVVKDAAGCTSSVYNVTVSAGPILNGTATITATTCLGASNGSLTINPGNGTGPFTYSINGGAYQSGATFNNLAAGNYTALFQNASGCISSPIVVVVNSGAAVTGTITKVDVSCNGGNTGSASISLSSNATAPLLYSFNNPTGTFAPASTFSNLSAGNYTIYYKEANGCNGSQTVTIAEPTAIAVNTNTQPATCNGASNGVLSVNASGGTPSYQYSTDGINWQNSNTFTVPAGSYTVFVKDANGCIVSKPNIAVTEPAALNTPTVVKQDATCTNNGSLTVTTNGGTLPYQYSSDGTTYQSSNVLSAAPGTYTVYVKDANGCIQTLPGNVIGQVSNLTITHGTVSPICEGNSVNLPANTNASQFTWTSNPGGQTYTTANPKVSPRVTTDYYLHATLANCSIYDTVTVTVYPAPVANAGARDTICFGQSYQLDGSGSFSNGSNITNYTWSPSTVNFTPGNTIVNPTVTPTATTTYNLVVKDALGCTSLQSSSVTIVVTPPLRVYVTPIDTVVAVGDTVRLSAFSLGTNYNWTPSFGLLNANRDTVFAVVSGDIVYKVIATTNAGCKGEGYARIKVYAGPEIYMPNAFTPNRDGLNDVFRPFTVGIRELHYFRVFNRWGQIVYETKTLFNGWDGAIGGKDQPVGTYVWMVEGVTKDGRVITKKGTVTLIR